MPEVADLWVKLRAETAPFTRGLGDAAVKGESFTQRMGGMSKAMSKLGKATAAVGIGVAVASVKMASDFQTQMTRLQTAAGLTGDKMKAIGLTSDGLNQKVLALGSSVGVSGTKMAEALYHPISAGLDLASALNVVKYAAEESKISGASLEDTTYSLSSVMKAFNFPASQAKQTMASLNAIVGQGDMRFQDFNESVKNWAPTAAQMGISVNSMGAGLAYLTDRGNSAEVASTRLTMGIAMMTTPSAKATKMLTALGDASTDVHASSQAMQKAMEDSGITQNRLAADLKKPDGLYVALNDLKTSLKKAGVSGTEADSVLSKIFGGGRSDKAIMSLMQNLDGVKTKFQDISKASGTKNFDAQWAKTQQTFSMQMAKIKASAENLGIQLGLKLIPPLQKFFGYLQQHQGVVKGLATVIGGVLAASVLKFATGSVVGAVKGVADIAKGVGAAGKAVKAFATSEKLAAAATKVWEGIQAAFNLVMDANPIVLVVIAIVALVAVLVYAYYHSARFRAIVQEAFHAVEQAALAVWHGMQAAWNGIVAGVTWLWQHIVSIWHGIESVTSTVWNAIAGFFRKWWPLLLVIFLPFLALVIAIWNHFHKQIEDTAKAVWNGIKSFFSAVWDGIKSAAIVVWQVIAAVVIGPMEGLWSMLKSLWHTISGWLSSMWHGIESAASATWSSIKSAMINPLLSAWHSISSTMSQIASSISGGLHSAWNAVKNVGSWFASIGSSIVHGIVSGVENAAGSLFSSLKNLASNALSSAKSFLGINSPSRVFAASVGRFIPEGIAQGVSDHAGVAHASVRSVAEGMVKQAARTLGIASPSKVFRNLGIYLNEGLVDGLTGSTARVKAATRRIESLLQETYNRVSDLRGTRGVSNRWVNAHEAALRHLESYAAREDRTLRSLAARRDAITPKIKAAQKALAAVQKEWSKEVKTVADGVMQGFSVVTAAPQEGFALTAADVVNHMQDQYQRAAQFAAELQTLQRKGLSSTLIQQLAQAGVDQGGATAAALAGATKGQIKQLNSLQSATQSAANGVGVAVADSMYGAGLKSAEGLVKGLQSQQHKIEQQMMRIAESMQKAIKKALGIRSPSRVFEEIATWIPKGLAKGVDGSAHHAVGAVNRLAGAMAGAGARGGTALAMAGGGTTVVNQYTVNVTVEGSVRSDRDLRDVVEQQMLRLGMRNSQTYASYKR